jgi:NADH:ubiquinone oxidoreductase subunit 2 (subunit N)
MFDWLSILPHLTLAGGGFLVLCVGAFGKRISSGLLFALALITVCLAGAASVWVVPAAPHFLGMLEVKGYGRFFTFLFSMISGLTLLFSYQYGKNRGMRGEEFFSLILFAALGMALVAGAVHWLIFLLGLEVLSPSMCSSPSGSRPGSNEAGISTSSWAQWPALFSPSESRSLFHDRFLGPGANVEPWIGSRQSLRSFTGIQFNPGGDRF